MTTSTHYLTFLANEDEAQHTGYSFEADGNTVTVTPTFHFPEYAEFATPRVMTREEARKLWKELVATGEYEARP